MVNAFCPFLKCVMVHISWRRETGLSPPVNYFTDRFKPALLCYLCLVFDMLSRLFIAALWSPAWKVLTYWLLFVMSNCDFVTFPSGILGQLWYLIVWIPDLCRLSYFYVAAFFVIKLSINILCTGSPMIHIYCLASQE